MTTSTIIAGATPPRSPKRDGEHETGNEHGDEKNHLPRRQRPAGIPCIGRQIRRIPQNVSRPRARRAKHPGVAKLLPGPGVVRFCLRAHNHRHAHRQQRRDPIGIDRIGDHRIDHSRQRSARAKGWRDSDQPSPDAAKEKAPRPQDRRASPHRLTLDRPSAHAGGAIDCRIALHQPSRSAQRPARHRRSPVLASASPHRFRSGSAACWKSAPAYMHRADSIPPAEA